MTFRRGLLQTLALVSVVSSGAGGTAARAQSPAPRRTVTAVAASPRTLASPLLARPVALPALRAPLEMVLREVARRAGVGLAYSATRLQLSTEVTITAQPRQSLEALLAVVLRDQPVAYGVLDGQIVLWRRADAPPPGVAVGRGASARPAAATAHAQAILPSPATSRAPARVAAGSAATSARSLATRPATRRPSGAQLPIVAAASATNPGASNAAVAPAARSRTAVAAGNPRKAAWRTAAKDAAPAPRSSAGSSRDIPRLEPRAVTLTRQPDSLAADALAAQLPHLRRRLVRPPAPAPWVQRPVQLSLLPALSTNWHTNQYSVNRLSINLLAGHAAGVRGLEAGLLVNSVRDSVAGLQAAGMLNLAGGPVVGAQVAGLGNVARGSLEGVQSAGLWNVVHGPAQGWQSAGLFNRAHTRASVADSVLPDPTTAPEPLVQLAGLFNSAPRGIKGAQVAGLFNSAGRVQGAQIAGLLNIADTVAGVSLAPLNFVRHGYHTLELTNDGTWPGVLTLKLGGSAAFYTYFVGTWDWRVAHRWGIGYGIGGELASRRRLSLSIDAHAVQVNQDDTSLITWVDALNLHTQLRPLVGWATGPKRRFRLVAGPAFNLFVTNRPASLTAPADELPLGGGLGFDTRSTDHLTRVAGWLSAIVGVRWKF